jgi:hypothetical protein
MLTKSAWVAGSTGLEINNSQMSSITEMALEGKLKLFRNGMVSTFKVYPLIGMPKIKSPVAMSKRNLMVVELIQSLENAGDK